MTTTSITNQPTTAKRAVYPPSFLDRFMDFIQRLPLPYWLTYLLLFLLQSLIIHILGWSLGWPAPFKTDPMLFMFPIWQWLPFAIMTYTNSVALEALKEFSPLLHADESELSRLRYEFTNMPARGVLLNGLFWGVVFAALMYATFGTIASNYSWTGSISMVVIVEGLICYVTGSVIYYHSLRQLWLVNRTVRMAHQFNVFRLDPAYAFSRLTSLTGISWMVMITATLLTFPIQFISGMVLGILLVMLVLAVMAFVLPLWFVHHRIQVEKQRLLGELDRHVETTTARLHRLLDADDMPPVTPYKDAMLALDSERKVLESIPTWPWTSGTLTGFISATVLPILLFIVQLVIQKWLGG
jgi:hypothetical protein